MTTGECISDNITNKELSKEIEELLDNLSVQDRELFMKLYVEEKEVEEVSKEMNLKKSNIYNRVSRGKSKLRKLFNKYTVAACILIMAMFLVNENTMSYAKHIIENITYGISKALGLSSNLDDYKTILNKSISKNGLEVKIDEVVLNNDEVVFTYIVKSDKKFEEIGDPSLHVKNISINNKAMGGVGGSTSDYIDEYTQKNVMRFTPLGIGKDELKTEVDIIIEFDKATSDDGVINGPWVFKFKADGEKLSIDTEVININKVFKLEGGAEIVINKYTKNDLGEKLYTSIENYDYSKSYDLYIVGEDENGTKIRFMCTSSSGEEPILEREDDSDISDAKNIKLRVHAAEVDSTYTPMKNDFKPIGEEFTIGS